MMDEEKKQMAYRAAVRRIEEEHGRCMPDLAYEDIADIVSGGRTPCVSFNRILKATKEAGLYAISCAPKKPLQDAILPTIEAAEKMYDRVRSEAVELMNEHRVTFSKNLCWYRAPSIDTVDYKICASDCLYVSSLVQHVSELAAFDDIIERIKMDDSFVPFHFSDTKYLDVRYLPYSIRMLNEMLDGYWRFKDKVAACTIDGCEYRYRINKSYQDTDITSVRFIDGHGDTMLDVVFGEDGERRRNEIAYLKMIDYCDVLVEEDISVEAITSGIKKMKLFRELQNDNS